MKRNRKEGDDEEGHRRRLSKSQGREERPALEAPLLEAQPWDLQAGMILEVKLRNFMCHEVIPATMTGLMTKNSYRHP